MTGKELKEIIIPSLNEAINGSPVYTLGQYVTENSTLSFNYEKLFFNGR